MFFQGRNHAGCDASDGLDAITTGENLFSFVSAEADDLMIPRRFTESFQDLCVRPAHVVADGDEFEVGFDQSDQGRMAEDFGAKDLAALSSRDFREDEEDGLSRGLGGCE